ncbi:VCBS domain-containing protein [Shewanella sp. Bg11-22]|uniref:VCBS domain-containing protein n=1 Tax=Shewanella sp. Bg11-22 TaxID=2058304 RepID=UPI000C31BBC7|nr:VCBS domain-containing protein [Shewanella sp. Bg11-22]PKH57741.1 hypothetical protein CXF84_07075 [Shewanella sp. Bg11-22]
MAINSQQQIQQVKEDSSTDVVSGSLHAQGHNAAQIEWSIANSQGQFGLINIDPATGQWHYQLNNASAATNALAENEHHTEQFIITATDAEGNHVETIITVEVEGSNDLPTISGTHHAALNEHGAIDTASGSLIATDSDHGDSVSWAVTNGQGQMGSLTIDPNTGGWQYHLNNQNPNTLALNQGQSATETFTVTATDSSGLPVSQQITVQVNGSNESAQIAGTTTGSITEDKDVFIDQNGEQLKTTGQLTVTDPDSGQDQFTADHQQGQYGELSINNNGHWTYTANNGNPQIQELKTGETVTDTLLVHSVDGTEQKITVTINGTDDKAVIGGTSTASLIEDKDLASGGTLRADGQLTVTDPDSGQDQFTADHLQGQYGELSINNNGHWTYTANNGNPQIQGLKTGETVTDTLLVHSVDGTEQKITVTINGTDDKALIGGTSTASLTEDKDLASGGTLRADGQLTVTDPDSGQDQFTADHLQGQYGELSINNNGHWTYTSNNGNPQIQGLKTGETVTDTLLVRSIDGTELKIIVTINGTNDLPVVSHITSKIVDEGSAKVTGQIASHDLDHGDSATFSTTYQHAGFNLNTDGSYTFDPTNPSFEYLAVGEHETLIIPITATDNNSGQSSPQNLVIRINGTNDLPVVSHISSKIVDEGNAKITGQIAATDLDHGDTATFSTSFSHAGFILNSDGGYSLDPTDPSFNHLAVGEHETLIIPITATDNNAGNSAPQNLIIRVNGTNDLPVVSHISSKTVDEGNAKITGQIAATDLDHGDTATFSTSFSHAGFILNSDGGYSLDPTDPSFNHLAVGEHETLIIPITATDNNASNSAPQNLIIRINGTNDLPVVSHISSRVIDEGGASVTGKIAASDLDHSDMATFATSYQHAGFSLKADGSYTLDPTDPSFNHLAVGEHETLIIPITATDNNGGNSAPQNLIIKIDGTNDLPVVSHISSKTVDEGNAKITGQIAATDLDHGDTATFSTSYQHAGFNLKADGSYTLDPTDPSFNHLAVGEHETLIIPITATDNNGGQSAPQNLIIKIDGTNDLPVVSHISSRVIDEGGASVTGKIAASDLDHGDTATFSTSYQHAGFNLKADGSYTLDPTDPSFNHLAVGEHETLIIPITATDNNGGQSAPQNLIIKIDGTNDLPVVSHISSRVIDEGGASVTGKIASNDLDHGDTATFSTSFSHAGFSLNPDGSYTLDPTDPSFNHLAVGEHETLIIPISTTDNNAGNSAPQNLVIRVKGTNDLPVVSQISSKTVDEGDAKITGQIASTDLDHGDSATFATNYRHSGFSLNPDGSYTLDPTDPSFNHLAVGEHETLIIPITATDNNAGNSTPQNLVIRVNGTNDLPIVSHISSKMVDEGSKPITGQITSTDVDHGDTATFSTNFSHTGFILNTDGSYTLDPTDPSFDHLAQGDHQTLIIPIIATDNNKGNSVSQNLIIRIDGTNDGAIISGVNTGNVTEESQLQTSGKLTVTDVDAGEAHFSNTDISGALGTLHLTDTGAWTYDLDNKNPKVQTLAQGQSTTDTVTVQSVDGTKHQITITVNGSNDKAIITGVDTGNVTEDVNPYSNVSASAHMIHTRGQLTITDTDSGEDHFDFKTFIHVATNPEWAPYHSQLGGRVSMTKNGEWEYEIDTTKPQIQALGAGETLKDSAVIESTDGTKHTIEFTIHGTNDVPTCSSEVVLSTGTEDTDIILTQAQLLANSSDIDNNDLNQLHVANLTADHGTITVNKDGSFTLHPDKDYNGQVQFSYDVKDLHGGMAHTGASTTLTAINDNPDVSPLTDSIKEGASHNLDLLTGATDIEGDTLHIDQLYYSIDGAPSTAHLPAGLSLAADGHTLIIDATNPAYNHLANGQSLKIAVSYLVEDGHGGQSQQTADLTIQGTDDKAALVSNIIQMTETQAIDSQHNMYRGTLQLIDPDSGDKTHFEYSGTYLGKGFPPGDLTVRADGSYQFILQSANNRYADDHIASLRTGESMQIPYEIKTSDGQSLTIMVKVIGEDNQARIEVAPGSSLTNHGYEDRTSASDPNQIWSGGNLHVIDPDHDQAGFIAQNISTSEGGKFFINPRGDWAYTIDNSKIQHLGQGESYQKTFSVESIDGSAHQDITVTVHGTNDAPVVSAEVRIASGIEDTSMQLSTVELLANATDIDHNDVGQLSIANLVADHGVIIDNNDGTFSFTPEKDYNGQVHFSYDVKDAHGGSTHTGATTTLTAVQDNAVITGQDSGSVTEDRHVSPAVSWFGNMIETQGQLHITDADSGENHFEFRSFITDAMHPQWAPYTSNLGGHLSIGPKGLWEYKIDTSNAVIQKLGAGETALDKVVVHSIDGTEHEIQITIHGTNDVPYCSSEVQLSSGTEDKDIHLTKSDLLINATDIDHNDIGQLSVANLTADHGTITVNKDGSFTLHPEKDYNGAVHFSYDVKDPHGGVTHTGATTSLAAVNDAAKVTEFNTESIVEDAPHSSVFAHEKYQIASGKLNVADADAGEDHFQYSQFGETAISDPFQGHLRISSAGSWNYEVKNSALQYLAAGQTETVVYRVNTADGTPYDLHIKVIGTNDTPTVTVITLPHGTEDVSYQMQASQLGFTDVDSGDTLHSVAITSAPDASTQGSFYLDGKAVTAGQTIAAGDISKMQFVPVKDFNGDVDFKYTVNDGHADSVEASNTIHIEPVADLAIISGDTSGQATEDSHIVNSAFLQASGQLNVTDADTLENSFQAENLHQQSDGSASMGGLAMQKDGSWSYVVDNARSEIQSLGVNQQLTEKFTVHSADGTEQELMVTIHGTNDAPSLSFNSTTNTSGQLLGSDIDNGDAQQLQYDAIRPHGQFGSISVDSVSGAYNYQPSNSIAGMSYDPQTHTYTGHEVFEVRVGDSHGSETREFLTFTVTATVSAPAITGGQPTVSTAINTSPMLTTQAPTGVTNTPPANSVNLDLMASSDSGTSNTDNLTNDNTPTITGTTDVPFSRVTIYDGNTPVGHALSDANGDYSANLASLADGTHNLSAKALAPSSVLPVVSPLLDIKIDTSMAVPTVDLTATADSGISDHDNLTNAHTPIITGTAEANSTITITDEHGATVATGYADASGMYQLTTSNLAEGAHSITVEATDTAGNQSHASLSLEVDYTAPTIAKVNLKIEAVHQPTFSGSVSLDTAQVDIVVKQGSQIIETLHATLDGKGGYSVDASNLLDGAYVAYIQATDNAGNQTPSGAAGIFDRFSVDTYAGAPTISFETAGADHIYNAQEVAAGAVSTITATVHLPADTRSVDSITINGNSHQISNAEFMAGKVEVEVAPGTTVIASITDRLGNISALTNATAPSADLLANSLTLSLTHDSGVTGDQITNDGSLTITGQEAGANVEYSNDNGVHWSQSFTPISGRNTVTVRQTDTAGNVSPSTQLSFTLDNQVAAPSISLQHDTSAHSGQHADLITKDGQLNIAAEAGAKLEYSVDGGHSWTTQFTPIEGQNNLQVRQTDIAGNTSAATSFSYTLDTTPVTVAVDPISKDNALNTVENNQSLEITGTTSNIAAGDQVYVKFDDNSVYLATVKADGTWRLTLNASEHQSHMATDKNYPIKVGAVDVAGNVTPEITTHLLLDTQNPIPHISVNPVTADNIINLAESGRNIEISGQVSGDFNAGDAISLSVNGAAISSLTGSVDAQGHYSISVPAQTLMRANIHSIYASGQQQIHSIEATVITTDSAGNLGSATTGTQAFTIDTQARAAITLDNITSDNVINAQESGTDISVTGQVSGDAHQGDIVNFAVGQHSYSATVGQSGHFSVNIAGAELASNASITASVTTIDTAGNPATASQVMHYATDTQVDMPTITFENPGSDNAYSKAEIAQGHAGTITATIHAAADAKIGEHLSINGVDHVLDANSLAHGIALEVAPSSIVKAVMTDEHGNVNSALNMAAGAKPEPIVVTAPPGSHHIGASLGVPTLIPTQTPVPVAEQGWKILVNGHYQTSYSSQWGTLTINPKTGQLNYQEHADTHTGPHGSATTVGVHEDRFEVALQGSHHDDVIMHVQVNILSRGPGHSGKLTLGSEVLDMTVTPTYNHPAPTAADAHDVPQSDFITDVSVDLDAIVVADDSDFNAAAHTEYEEPSTASAAEQAEADPAATSQPVSATPVVVSAAVTSDPIDHYLQMVGMSHQDLAPKTDNPSMNELPEMQVLTSGEPDADMFDTNQVDAFDNPLLDDDKHDAHHKDLTTLDDVIEHQSVDQANDDDLLHQALNDMHNQL